MKSINDAIKTKQLNAMVESVVNDKNKALTLVGNITSAVLTNPALRTCTTQSIIGSSLIAQSLNLSLQPQMGRCWMIPYKRTIKNRKTNEVAEITEAQFQMGYLGYVELMLRTGLYSKLGVKEVYENELGDLDEFGELTFNWQKEKKGDIVGYFAYYVMNSGMKKSIFMSKDEMERFARKYSKSYGTGKSTDCWTNMFDEMAKKTCLKRLIKKYGIINESKPIETAMKYDSGVVKENGEVEYIDNESNVETQEPLKLGAENE